MDLLVQTLLITLVAAFGFAHDGVGSTMWNRPIVMAPLVGLVLGDIRTGNIKQIRDAGGSDYFV